MARFRATIEHLVEISPTFRDIDAAFLRSKIVQNEIVRCQFKKGDVLIEEHDSDCNHFFALLSGELEVLKNGEKLATINKVCSFGSIGYFTGKRSAKVVAAADTTVLALRRDIIRSWPDRIQIALYENLARELSHIVGNTNHIIAGDARCSDKITGVQEQLSTLGI